MNYKITTQSSLRALQKAGRSNPVVNFKNVFKSNVFPLGEESYDSYESLYKKLAILPFQYNKFISGLLRPAFCRARNDEFGNTHIFKKQTPILLFKHNFLLKLTSMHLRGNDERGGRKN